MQAHHHHHIHWNSHHLRHWQSHLHLPWYLHVHRSDEPVPAGAYVGRVGALAIALGIGAAVAGGFCAACATADAETGHAADDTSTSQSVDAGPPRSAQVNPATTVTRHTNDIRVAMRDSVMAPSQSPKSRRAVADTIASPPAASVPRAATAVALSEAISVDKPAAAPAAATARAPRVSAQLLAAAAKAKASESSASGSSTWSTSSTTSVTESERMVVSPRSAARIVSDRNASGGSALAISGSATASITLTVPTSTTGLVVRARASGGPNMTVSIDGAPVTTLLVTPTGWTDFTFAGAIPAGSHVVSISTTTAGTRNVLYVDKMSTITGSIKDDFSGKSGSAPNDALWSVRSGSGFDSGIASYATSNAYLDGQGHLVIQAVKTKSGGYSSGWVWSKNDVSYGYGTVTARIKMPKGQGLAPAFWLMGADSDTVGWPGSGEIDVVEMPSTTTTVYSTVHGPIAGSSNTQQVQIVSTLPDLSADYHNYWVTHLEDQITFGIDNQTLGTITPDSLAPGETWVYNRPMYIMLNLSVGGSWAGAPNGSTLFPAKMIVDSVQWDPAP